MTMMLDHYQQTKVYKHFHNMNGMVCKLTEATKLYFSIDLGSSTGNFECNFYCNLYI